METFTCHDCGQVKPVQTSGGTGYATDDEGNKICYDCCAIREEKQLREDGEGVLYLLQPQGALSYVSNWPGTLKRFVRHQRKSTNNFGATRWDVWFCLGDGFLWHGVQIGNNTQICRVKRTKQKE